MVNDNQFSNQSEKELIDAYENIFRTIIDSSCWENISVEVDDSTPDEIAKELKNSPSMNRGRDYLFKYTGSAFSKSLIELRIPSIRTGDLLIGGLSYTPESKDLDRQLSSEGYEKANNVLIDRLVDSDSFLKLDNPSHELPNSDIVWIKIEPSDSGELQFEETLQQLEDIISQVDKFYSEDLPAELEAAAKDSSENRI